MDSSLVRTCPGIGRPCDRTVPHNPHDTRTISDRGIRRTLAIGHSTGMVELFHTPAGACRDDAHAPCHQQAEEPEDGDDDDYAHRVPSLHRGFSFPVPFFPHAPRPIPLRGDCEGVWRVEPVFLFRFRTSLDGRHGDRRDMRRVRGRKTAGTGSGNPCMGFRRPVLAVCRMVSDVRLCSGCGLVGLLMLEAVKTCEEGQTRPMPGSSGISAGSGGWSPGDRSSNPWAGCKPIMWGAATSL